MNQKNRVKCEKEECQSINIKKKGVRGKSQRFECKDCGHRWSLKVKGVNQFEETPLWKTDKRFNDARRIVQYISERGDTEAKKKFKLSNAGLQEYKDVVNFENTQIPKVLFIDIETAPLKVLSWSLWKPMISHENILADWYIISWSARWMFSGDVMSDVLTPKEAIAGDDKRIMKSIWPLLEGASIVCGHNGNAFDLPRLNTRFILNGLKPPAPYQSIDTLTIARKYFKFASNRLDYLGQLVRNKGKIKTNFDLWRKCMNGDQDALTEMVTYNKEDVVLLEEVYFFLRPWIKSHPNLSLICEATESVCPTCGSPKIEELNKPYRTMVGSYTSFRCTNCGAIGRRRISELTLTKRKALTVSVAR
jgi:transposase-like protein